MGNSVDPDQMLHSAMVAYIWSESTLFAQACMPYTLRVIMAVVNMHVNVTTSYVWNGP